MFKKLTPVDFTDIILVIMGLSPNPAYNTNYMNEDIKQIQNKIEPILNKYQIKKLSIFGSFVRGEKKADSDIDLLVELGEQKGLFTLVRLKRDLEKVLNKKVDLLTYNSINPLLKESIMKDELKIYG